MLVVERSVRAPRIPGLRSIYLRSLERHWEVMRMQQVPWFNFIYGALTVRMWRETADVKDMVPPLPNGGSASLRGDARNAPR